MGRPSVRRLLVTGFLDSGLFLGLMDRDARINGLRNKGLYCNGLLKEQRIVL